MNKVINLNKFRKKKARAERDKSAEENRAKFGRTKAERKKSASDQSKLDKHLDGHQQDD